MGKGSNTTTTAQQSTYTPTGSPYINTALQTASNAAATPYQSYSGELTAPVNAQQQTGISGINAAANLAQPYYNTAQGYATSAGTPLTAAQIAQYQNPYTQSVVNATQAQFNNQNAQQQNQVVGNAAAQGALGGDRVAVAQAQLAGQQQTAQAPVIAGLYNQSYAQGLQTAQQQQAQQGNAAAILGGLGTGNENAALSGAGAQVGAGTLEQQTSQSQDTAAYQQYLNALAYPFQTSQFLTQAVGSLAPGLGGTTTGTGTTTGPTPNSLNSILGAATTAASFLPSDERVKENIEKIGKLFDGQNIYRFNYKGDPTTRVGLIAQEVEKTDPHAVAHGLDGLKMVDHHKATDEAADRQHFASGGFALPYAGTGGNPAFGGYVPVVSGISAAQTPQPKLPGVQPMQQQQGMSAANWSQLGGIGKTLGNYFQPGGMGNLGDDGLGNLNDASWTGGTSLDDASPIGGAGGGIGSAARGGRIRGYDDGGYVPAANAPLSTAPTQIPQLINMPKPQASAAGSSGLSSLAGLAGGAAKLFGIGGGSAAGAGATSAGAADAAGAAGTADAGAAAGGEGLADLAPLLLLAKRGGRIKGYDDGGVVAPINTPSSDLPILETPSSNSTIFDPAYYAPSVSKTLADANYVNANLSPVVTPNADIPVATSTPATVVPPVAPLDASQPIPTAAATDITSPTAGYANNISRYANATSAVESGGSYDKLGPVIPKTGDRAYGKYQVMGENIPQWTSEVLGKPLSPAEFLANPQAQDAVYRAKFGQYVNQYGPEGAARAWFAGPVNMNNLNARDALGTSVADYSKKFMANLDGGRTGDSAALPPSSTPTQGVVSPASSSSGLGLSNPFAQNLAMQSGSGSTASNDGTPSWYPFPKMSDATKQQLMATGFGMMASRSPWLGQAIGEGGLQGVSTAQKAQELSRQADLARSEIAMQTATTGKTNVETQAAQETLNAVRALRGDPGVQTNTGVSPAASAATPKSGLTSVLPQGSNATANAENPQQTLQAAQHATSSVVGFQQTPQGGVVGVNRAGQPVVNPNDLLVTGNRYIRSGVPAFQAAGEKMLGLYDTMISKGMGTDQNGNVIPLPGAVQTQSDIAGAKAGAEARQKFPYEYFSQLARNAGRPTTVGPNQVVTTAEQFNPDIQSATKLATSLLPGGAPQNQAPPQATGATTMPWPSASSANGAPSSPLGIPASGPGVSQFTPHLVQNSDGSWGSSVTPGSEKLQEDTAKAYEQAGDNAKASQNMKYRLNLVEHDLDQLNAAGSKAWYNSGSGANGRLEFAKVINSYAGLIGAKPPFDTAKVGAWEDLTKESTQLGFATARTLGAREAMQIVQQAITANPGMANTPAGARLVLNSIRYAAKSDADYYDYATQYAQSHGGDLVGAQTAFYKEHPPSQYSQAALAAGTAPLHVANLKAHPETAAQFDAKYGPGTAAIILSE